MSLSAEAEPPSIADTNAVPTLRANFSWTLAGNVFYGACQWGMLSALAKLGNASIVGEFTLGLAISSPIFVFTNLQLRSVQATDTQLECRFADYFTLRALATAFGLGIILVLLPFSAGSRAVRLVVLLVSISKCVECMSDVIAGLLQREERLKRVAISLMLRGGTSVAVFTSIFACSHSLAWSVVGMSVTWLAVFLLYDLPGAVTLFRSDEGFLRFNLQSLRSLLMLSLPLGWATMIGNLNVNIPRYILQHDLGFADQGIFASLAYLVVAINMVVLALTQSVTTRLARIYFEGRLKDFRLLLTRLSMLGVLITAAGVPLALLFGRQALTLLYRPEYGDHAGLLALFAGTAGLSTMGSFLFCGACAARAFRIQVPVYLVAMLVGTAGSAILVPLEGMIGAGIALLLSAITIVLSGLWVMAHLLRPSARKNNER